MTGMSTSARPAGWYRDPLPANPDFPETERFWDGRGWTGQVRMGSRKQRAAWREEVLAERRAHAQVLVERADRGDAEALRELMGPAPDGTRDATDDGDVLAGWWRRFFAHYIDQMLSSILVVVFGWRFLRRIAELSSSYADAAVRAAERGVPAPAADALLGDLVTAFGGLLLVSFGVCFLYEVAFLRAFQGTPGKLFLGLEVRLAAVPGPLPWSAIGLRVLMKYGVGILTLVPFAGLLVAVYSLVDYLWPLWDPRRQALHDKVARTQVVRRRG